MKSVGRSPKSPVAMSIARVVTPRASTRSRDAASENRAMPQTSLSAARYWTSGKAIWPAGPVTRILVSDSGMAGV